MHTPLSSAALLLALAALSLSACEAQTGDESGGLADNAPAAETAAPEADEDGRESADIATAESGWLTVGIDGAVQTTFLDSGGRYRDFRNGELNAEGGWHRRPDGRLCFEPDEGLPACWQIEPSDTGANGDSEAIAEDEDGKRVVIRRISYVGPPAEDDAAE